MGWLETGSDTCVMSWDRWDLSEGKRWARVEAVTGPWHNQGCDNALPFKGIVPMPQDYRIGNYLCCVATVANRFGSARAARHKGMGGKKRLRGAAAASVAPKRPRLEAEAETPTSWGGSAPPPLPLSPQRPPRQSTGRCMTPAWSFGENLRESLVPKQYRAKVVDLQALADSVRSGEVPKARLEKEAKAWVSEVEKHFRMAGPKKKGSAGAAVGSATETNRLLERISLQLEQVTEVLCKLAKVPVPGTPSVEEEFGGGEVVEE
ncbi:predicted protein [Histoplasma mississippiense (nom. inval.)]|uniref:predicted protein n=1 Tax=Ajellomyces capsulatus (strain NAm1 / WU24) TaxID=2059318 RepID=UPI000157C1EF|nr:predicted protein [Histoplasma mississippiense (nom. inval.)]EDN07176.1 predicted protein [Histoplasma mississippiense (nom. inval.)]